jgi:GNAT superfamily N-acetyltransferase
MRLRNFQCDDAGDVNRIAVAAFRELSRHYDDWPAMAVGLGRMSALADSAEIIVAEDCGHVIGAVAYVGPDREKPEFFDPGWPVMRLLVVDPKHRGAGAGRSLAEACIERALRDGSPVLALHTSPVMKVALPMYLRMGFELVREAPPIRGVPYSVYVKRL